MPKYRARCRHPWHRLPARKKRHRLLACEVWHRLPACGTFPGYRLAGGFGLPVNGGSRIEKAVAARAGSRYIVRGPTRPVVRVGLMSGYFCAAPAGLTPITNFFSNGTAPVPRRDDLHKILLIGSGPIVIGQACEFDYSGTQACKALREEGYEVVLVNSNPATIMTDPNTADRTYIEPLTWETLAKVIERERPDAVLPTVGGQTGLNLAMELHHKGVLKRFGVEMIGAKPEVIAKAEERDQFR